MKVPRSVEIFKGLLTQPHPNADVVKGIIEEAAQRKLAELAPDIQRLCNHYRTAVREAARNALAWEDIDDDEETKKRIDQSQIKLLQRNLDSARRQLKEDLFRAYRHLYLLD